MKRTTIDYGVDLGTTNSAIAVQNGVVPEVIKNNRDEDITSSAVHISKHGQLRVGQNAKAKLLDPRSDGDVYIEFKRRMGTDHVYEFRSTGQRRTPEDLSAEVLKSLCADVQQRTGEQVRAAVITVPAAFNQKQCAATKEAARAAGFRKCPLLQEPVAAALAYGFQSDAEREYWLVYDFGGGTFDAALLKADDGVIDVVSHGGDNNLGGADIDWAIVDKIVLPKVAAMGAFPGLQRGNARWQAAIARIKHAVEMAKIELSRSETTYLNDCIVTDDEDEEVEIDLPLTRDEVVQVARPIILESVRICQRVLKEKDMTPAMVTKVILVGGPTLAPYFRAIVSEELGVELDHSIDPLTVVARGAAVFAATQQFVDEEEPRAAGTVGLELNYSPVGPDEDFRVRGQALDEGTDFSGYAIGFVNRLTGWDSGRIPLKPDGRFKADLLAEAAARNSFSIQLLDPSGTVRPVSPDELLYTVGAHSGDQIVINSIGVEIGDNEYDMLIEKGTSLPARKMKIYRTTRALRKGETGDVLSVPIVEGENPKADRNQLQGELRVTANQIRRDVPAQEEVEVTLFMDEDRCIHAKAYIGLLDEDFETTIETSKRSPNPARLSEELRNERKRLGELAAKVGATPAVGEQKARIAELEDLVRTAQGDSQAALRAESRVLALKAGLDEIENDVHWPETVAAARRQLAEVDGLIAQTPGASAEQRQRARQLRLEVEELIAAHLDDQLRRKTEQVLDLYRQVITAQPAFWVAMFEHAKQERSKMTDSTLASRLIEQGDACLQRGDTDRLQQVVVQLVGLLPSSVQESVRQGGYAKGITLRR